MSLNHFGGGQVRIRTVIAVTWVLSVLCAEARLDESKGECEDRYGPPVTEEVEGRTMVAVYEKSGYRVKVEFELRKVLFFTLSRAVAVAYSKPESEKGNRPLSAEELNTFLSANAQDEVWRKLDMTVEATRSGTREGQMKALLDARKYTLWRRSDGAAAVYDREEHELHIRASDAAQDTDGSLTPAKSLNGF